MKRSGLIASAAALALACGVATLAHARHRDVRVIHITAKKFEYSPSQITLKKGVPVMLELTSLDRHHGFKLDDFGIRADVNPGQVIRIPLVPPRAGRFVFECDVFCGDGHEDMGGEIVVVE
ncbi:MAG TPA: cupredoxin domain-containing protein [Candidatus Kryptonia bacterium]|nr:cupredoxin domain-containing protein [Candidatus Kryptonia bacterium]